MDSGNLFWYFVVYFLYGLTGVDIAALQKKKGKSKKHIEKILSVSNLPRIRTNRKFYV